MVTIQTNPKDHMSMVWIPAGTFLMGSNQYPEEQPVQPVTLAGFWMYVHPVTSEQFLKYCDAVGKVPPPLRVWDPLLSHPAVSLSWADAEGYCNWAGVRLPTEAEWEYAARGGLEGMKFPWGNKWDRSMCVHSVGAHRSREKQPVCSTPPNGYGLYDMAGNVWEWCADWYDPHYYQSSPSLNPPGPMSGTSRVTRGGCYNDERTASFRCAERNFVLPTEKYGNYGFRACTSTP